MYFFTGDQHYFHKNIILPTYCNRPYRSESQMRQDITHRHNVAVSPKDEVYHMGDFAMCGTAQWEKVAGIVSKLNGIHHLILGNHDYLKPFTYIRAGFTSVHTSFWIDIDGVRYVMVHDPSVYCMMPGNCVLLCGHVHTLFKTIKDERILNVGVDVNDFNPLSFDQVKEVIAEGTRQ